MDCRLEVEGFEFSRFEALILELRTTLFMGFNKFAQDTFILDG